MTEIRSRIRSLGPGLFLSAVLAALLASTTARVEAEELKRVAERLVPFAPGGEIHIDDENGKLTVESWSRHEVRIQITRVARATERAQAEELMKELQAEVEVRKDRIDIVSRFPKRKDPVGLLDLLRRKPISLAIHYYLQVPAETDLRLRTANGEVSTRGITGDVDVGSTNGDIHVTSVKGNVEVSTSNGEVRLENVVGQTRAQTTNGSVVAQLPGIHSGSSVTLGTTNGNVEAWFDKGLKAELDATTTNGRISIDFPIQREGFRSSRTIHGTIQGGGAKISIQTTNGNVDVRPLGDRRR